MIDYNFKFTEVVRMLGRPVTFYPGVAHAFGGNVNAALFLSNFIYWEGKQSDKAEHWIFKTQREIQLETGLSRYQQESARKLLKEYGILEDARKGQPARMHYRFDWDKLNALLNKHYSGEKVEKEKLEDSRLFKMKTVFDNHYFALSGGVKFIWGHNNSKEWSGLKHMSIALEEVIAHKRCIDLGIEEPTSIDKDRVDVTEEDVIHSFDHFLRKLPAWHQKHSMNPKDLYSRFSKIIIEIRNVRNINGNQTKPEDFVPSSVTGQS